MKEKDNFKLDVVSVCLSNERPLISDEKIDSPEAAIKLVGEVLKKADREIVCVLNLQADSRPINCSFVSMGTLAYALVEPRELLKSSFLSNAAQVLLVHCHPSGNLMPSKADVVITDRMRQVCEMAGIPLVDHVIVGGDNDKYFSIREKCPIAFETREHYATDYNEIKWGIVAERGDKNGGIYTR